jgi:chemotaxis protein methyltransferase CheR
MEQRVFDKFRSLIYERSGITLGPGKVSLVSARVAKRMRALEFTEYRDYLDFVVNDATGNEIVHLLDAISTNVTSFFRESAHFDFLAQALAQWRAGGQTRFRIWSAASSTGEEPYTIGMVALEAMGGGNTDLRILATDISTRVLDVCMRGQYTENRVEPVPSNYLNRYFTKTKANGEALYGVVEGLRRIVTFRRLNLSTPPFPMKGPLDVVFCRNVMIYFDDTVRRRLIEEAHRLLKPGGYLLVGHSESLSGCNSQFKIVRPSVFQKQ